MPVRFAFILAERAFELIKRILILILILIFILILLRVAGEINLNYLDVWVIYPLSVPASEIRKGLLTSFVKEILLIENSELKEMSWSLNHDVNPCKNTSVA